jgi:hypothetical protein
MAPVFGREMGRERGGGSFKEAYNMLATCLQLAWNYGPTPVWLGRGPGSGGLERGGVFGKAQFMAGLSFLLEELARPRIQQAQPPQGMGRRGRLPIGFWGRACRGFRSKDTDCVDSLARRS